MTPYSSYILTIVGLILLLFIFCEYLIYYIVLIQCSWPELDPKRADESIKNEDNSELKAMLLADTHLLGSRKGHWFDKIRREWQMHRSFQTAVNIHRPDIVFILGKNNRVVHLNIFLGDIFDEGLWSSDAEFDNYVDRFQSLFYVPENTKLHVVVGNHDIGFHYSISPYLHTRFVDSFNAPSIRMLSIAGNTFVLINSMALEGDGCFLCRPAEIKINNIAKMLKCLRGPGPCPKFQEMKYYSRPIILQHFPMYRESDEGCNEPDEAPEDVKKLKFRERWECLSKESSNMVLETLNPRLVITGHTHHGCRRYHDGFDTYEYTIPSFSWRNKNNPSFILGVFTPNNYSIEKCYLPNESTVIILYIFGICCILCYALYFFKKHARRQRIFKVH